MVYPGNRSGYFQLEGVENIKNDFDDFKNVQGTVIPRARHPLEMQTKEPPSWDSIGNAIPKHFDVGIQWKRTSKGLRHRNPMETHFQSISTWEFHGNALPEHFGIGLIWKRTSKALQRRNHLETHFRRSTST